MEGVFDGFGEGGGDAGLGGDVCLGGGGKAAEGAEGGEELAFAGGADAGEFVEDGFFEGAEAEGAVEGDGEAVGFVAEADENLEGGGVAGEDEVGAAVIEDDFLEVLVEAGDGDGVEEAEFAEDGASGADLEFGAVAEDEVREGEAFVEDAGVAAADDLGHGVGVVVGDGADAEAAVTAFVDKEPNLVLLEAAKGGRPRITVEKPLIVYEKPGVYTEDIRILYGDGR